MQVNITDESVLKKLYEIASEYRLSFEQAAEFAILNEYANMKNSNKFKNREVQNESSK